MAEEFEREEEYLSIFTSADEKTGEGKKIFLRAYKNTRKIIQKTLNDKSYGDKLLLQRIGDGGDLTRLLSGFMNLYSKEEGIYKMDPLARITAYVVTILDEILTKEPRRISTINAFKKECKDIVKFFKSNKIQVADSFIRKRIEAIAIKHAGKLSTEVQKEVVKLAMSFSY
ncbi:hypothetical protein HOC80_04735 [archaeon]|jgi:hypothetical protein|nr:hypothetical protein [archaeon]MBT4417380.1 hypothetical protein [archaeon]